MSISALAVCSAIGLTACTNADVKVSSEQTTASQIEAAAAESEETEETTAETSIWSMDDVTASVEHLSVYCAPCETEGLGDGVDDVMKAMEESGYDFLGGGYTDEDLSDLLGLVYFNGTDYKIECFESSKINDEGAGIESYEAVQKAQDEFSSVFDPEIHTVSVESIEDGFVSFALDQETGNILGVIEIIDTGNADARISITLF